MLIIVDSREQRSYQELLEENGYSCVVQALPEGDYALQGVEGFALERKTLPDFISSITRSRGRFERELVRAQKYKYFAVILEFSLYDVQNRNYRSKIHPSSILGTITSWSIKYGIPFLFCESRTGGALMVAHLAKQFQRHEVSL